MLTSRLHAVLACVIFVIVGFLALIAGMFFWEKMKDPKVKEAENIQYFVETFFIEPMPATLRLAKVIRIDADIKIGETDSCGLAFSMDPATFDAIHRNHSWVTGSTSNADGDFYRTWPGAKIELEHYSYKIPNSSYEAWLTVSKDHTKAIFEVSGDSE